MTRLVLIVPHWIALPDEPSIVRDGMPALSALAERGRVVRLAPFAGQGAEEAEYLGLDSARIDLAQGPLTVAALGADPPDGSVHFHLSAMSLGETLEAPRVRLPEDHQRLIAEAARRLDTAALTFVKGTDRDHGLVWEEGSIDLGTHSCEEAAGKALKDVLPEGDGEVMLRRYIDDSINLLSEMEFNAQRIDEGLPPFNVLWPWGQGFRMPVPNVSLELGRPVRVESPLLRLHGLARLAGCRHGDSGAFGDGTNTRLELILEACEPGIAAVGLVSAIDKMRSFGRHDAAGWIGREIDKRVLAPLEERIRREPCELLLASPGPQGLALRVSHGPPAEDSTPFDERALQEPRAPMLGLAELVRQTLGG